MRYFCRVEYDGTNYSGWQIQTDVKTVQGEIERVLSIIFRESISLVGAGRTDRGVHGRRQAIHFDSALEIDCDNVERRINALLPSTIAIASLKVVDNDFHARFSALERQYKYYITTKKSPLNDNHSNYVSYPLDWDKMVKEANSLIGKHCFTSFCATGYYSDNHNSDIKFVSLEEIEKEYWCFTIRADRFVYKMIRTLAGTLIDIGRGKLKTSLLEIINKQDRLSAGATALPKGLVFDDVFYE